MPRVSGKPFLRLIRLLRDGGIGLCVVLASGAMAPATRPLRWATSTALTNLGLLQGTFTP